MGLALQISSLVMKMLPELVNAIESILGPQHPDVVAARDAVAALAKAHDSATASQQ